MTPLEKFLAEGDELAAKATAGPWGSVYGAVQCAGSIIAHAGQSPRIWRDESYDNASFIADARTRVVKQAAIIRVMREALQTYFMAHEVRVQQRLDSWPYNGTPIAVNALAEAERLAGEADGK